MQRLWQSGACGRDGATPRYPTTSVPGAWSLLSGAMFPSHGARLTEHHSSLTYLSSARGFQPEKSRKFPLKAASPNAKQAGTSQIQTFDYRSFEPIEASELCLSTTAPITHQNAHRPPLFMTYQIHITHLTQHNKHIRRLQTFLVLK